MASTTIRVFEAPFNPGCPVCGQGFDVWLGTRSFQFQDPLPANSVIKKITITVYGTACYSVSTTARINNETIGTGLLQGTCDCFDCRQLALSKSFSDGFANYVRGGANNLSVSFNDNGGFPSFIDITFDYATGITALVDVDPDTINLKSAGNFITVYIELPSEYDPHDIDINTVQLKIYDTTLPTLTTDYHIVDNDNDGINELAVKFDRQAVINALPASNGTVTVMVTGQLNDGTAFSGEDIIRVISPDPVSNPSTPIAPSPAWILCCPMLQACLASNIRRPLLPSPLHPHTINANLNTSCNCKKDK